MAEPKTGAQYYGQDELDRQELERLSPGGERYVGPGMTLRMSIPEAVGQVAKDKYEQFVSDLQQTISLPKEVYEGRVDLNTPEGKDRAVSMGVNLAGYGVGAGSLVADGGTTGMFIGPKSFLYDSPSARTAMEMADDDLDRWSIWSQTKNLRSPGGQYWQEIADNEMKVLKDFKKPFSAPLEEVIDHPELFKAYPALRSYMVHHDPGGAPDVDGTKPLGWAATDSMASFTEGKDPERIKELLLHEVQHKIQHMEGVPNQGGWVNAADKPQMAENAEWQRAMAAGEATPTPLMEKMQKVFLLAEQDPEFRKQLYYNYENELLSRMTERRKDLPMEAREMSWKEATEKTLANWEKRLKEDPAALGRYTQEEIDSIREFPGDYLDVHDIKRRYDSPGRMDEYPSYFDDSSVIPNNPQAPDYAQRVGRVYDDYTVPVGTKKYAEGGMVNRPGIAGLIDFSRKTGQPIRKFEVGGMADRGYEGQAGGGFGGGSGWSDPADMAGASYAGTGAYGNSRDSYGAAIGESYAANQFDFDAFNQAAANPGFWGGGDQGAAANLGTYEGLSAAYGSGMAGFAASAAANPGWTGASYNPATNPWSETPTNPQAGYAGTGYDMPDLSLPDTPSYESPGGQTIADNYGQIGSNLGYEMPGITTELFGPNPAAALPSMDFFQAPPENMPSQAVTGGMLPGPGIDMGYTIPDLQDAPPAMKDPEDNLDQTFDRPLGNLNYALPEIPTPQPIDPNELAREINRGVAFGNTQSIVDQNEMDREANRAAAFKDTRSASFSPEENFLRDIMPYAMEVQRRTGVDARVVAAQAALESRYGKSAPGNNYFGIKGPGQNLATKEVVNGRTVGVNASFRAYPDMESSVLDYGRLMERDRYSGIRSGATLQEQINALGKSGYATDPRYGDKVASIANGIDVGRYVGYENVPGGGRNQFAGVPNDYVEAGFARTSPLASIDVASLQNSYSPPVPEITANPTEWNQPLSAPAGSLLGELFGIGSAQAAPAGRNSYAEEFADPQFGNQDTTSRSMSREPVTNERYNDNSNRLAAGLVAAARDRAIPGNDEPALTQSAFIDPFDPSQRPAAPMTMTRDLLATPWGYAGTPDFQTAMRGLTPSGMSIPNSTNMPSILSAYAGTAVDPLAMYAPPMGATPNRAFASDVTGQPAPVQTAQAPAPFEGPAVPATRDVPPSAPQRAPAPAFAGPPTNVRSYPVAAAQPAPAPAPAPAPPLSEEDKGIIEKYGPTIAKAVFGVAVPVVGPALNAVAAFGGPDIIGDFTRHLASGNATFRPGAPGNTEAYGTGAPSGIAGTTLPMTAPAPAPVQAPAPSTPSTPTGLTATAFNRDMFVGPNAYNGYSPVPV